MDITCAEFSNLGVDDIDLSTIIVQIDGVNLEAQNIFSDIEKVTATKLRFQGWLLGDGTPTIRVAQQRVRLKNDPITLTEYDLDNIDTMRKNILADVASTSAYTINNTAIAPYGNVLAGLGGNQFAAAQPLEGLALKTYQSDLFNNWIDTDWIDGVGGVNDVTKVDTTGNEFTIDALNLAQKVYVMLNRIAISGGTYDDWLDAVYTHERAKGVENPLYHGSLIKELSFEEVISNSQFEGSNVEQPLGTLAV